MDDKPIDDRVANRIQALIRAGDKDRFTDLYAECKHIATVLAKSICSRHNKKLSNDRIEDIAHDTATVLIERMMKNPEYIVRSFRSILYLEALHRLTDGEHKDAPSGRKQTISLDMIDRGTAAPDTGDGSDPRDYLHDLIAEPGIGPRVVRDLARCETYRKAVKAIEEYAGEPWIRERAVKLAHVFRILSLSRN